MVRFRHALAGVVAIGAIVACTHALLHLHDHEQASLVLDGDGDFKEQFIDTDSAELPFTVQPTPGFQDHTIDAIDFNCPDFHLAKADGLPVGEGGRGPDVFRHCASFDYGGDAPKCTSENVKGYDFTAVFHPTKLGATNGCVVTVHFDGGDKLSLPVGGTGIPPAHVAVISRNAMNFGEANFNVDSQAFSVVITNAGSQQLTVSASLTNTSNAFTLAGGNPSAHPIDVGKTDQYSIRCHPPSVTTFHDTLTITTNDPNRATIPIDLDCAGVDSAISIALENVDTRVDQMTPIHVVLTNTSQPPVAVTLGPTPATLNTSVAGLTLTTPATPTLQPGDQLTLDLQWMPGDVFSNMSLGTIDIPIVSQTTRHTQVAAAALARRAIVSTDLAAMPPVLDFGSLCIGDIRTQSFKMLPSGEDPLVDGDYAITGSSGLVPPFSTVAPPVNAIVASPNTPQQFDVTVMPVMLGDNDQTLTITTDAPGQNTLDVAVHVAGLAPGATVTPNELTFQRTIVTGYTNSQKGTFRNCTFNDIMISDVALDGASAPDFQLTSITAAGATQVPPFMLAKNDAIEVEVQMLPQTDGVKAARVSFDYQLPGATDVASESIALSGEAFDHGAGRDTYYHCSAGRLDQAWPLGLVVVGLLRRRRRR